jgi:4-methylaminobutanoate oxidase (formaldehyde-forming)
MYSVHYPGEIFESARGRRFSPVHSELLKAGAVFGETYGWERPLYFPRSHERFPPSEEAPPQDPNLPSPEHSAFSFQRAHTEFFLAESRECVAARETAALFDLSSFGKLVVSGSQALNVMQMCMTAEMDKKIGSATYSLFCDTKGGIQGDLAVTRLGPEQFYITTIAIHPEKVKNWLHRIAVQLSVGAGGFNVEDVTEAKAILALNGPKARTIMKTICEDPLDKEKFST